ncbi:Transmembrane E3 ubiquitin-protein ligase 1 [Yarrowia sp. B02]|nr:Transmembrane E3 ubiquitin-protein ligase 1 [Yarrowia sp. B02]
MESVFRIILFIMLMGLLMSPGGNRYTPLSGSEKRQLEQLVADHQYQADRLRNHSAHDYSFGNLTGFSFGYTKKQRLGCRDEGDQVSLFPKELLSEAASYWKSEKGLYLRNISGVVRGDWTGPGNETELLRIPMPVSQQNWTWHPHNHSVSISPLPIDPDDDGGDEGEQRINGNITAVDGKVELDFIDAIPSYVNQRILSSYFANRTVPKELEAFADVNVVTCTANLMGQESDSELHTVTLRGLHFKHSGNVIMTTHSAKFWGYEALAGLLAEIMTQSTDKARDDAFNTTKEAMMPIIERYLSIIGDTDQAVPVAEMEQEAAATCEYIGVLHVDSVDVSRYTGIDLRNIESELQYPVGRPHKRPPRLHMSGVLYSPDCGKKMTVAEAKGLLWNASLMKQNHVVVAVIFLGIINTLLLAFQMQRASTPSLCSRVSIWSIGVMSMMDGFMCMFSLMAILYRTQPQLQFTALAFVSFTYVSLFGLRFMLNITLSQIPEEFARPAVIQTPGNAQDTTPGGDDTLPVTETQPAAAPFVPSDADVATALYGRFYFCLLAFVIVTTVTYGMTAPRRYVMEYIIVLGMASLWLPQIYRSAYRGTQQAPLAWYFMVGSSVTRLLPLYYVCLVKDDVFRHRIDRVLPALATFWIVLQLGVIYAQHKFGPRFILPQHILPPIYDYHPIISQDDIESGSYGALFENAANGSLEDAHTDCSICMNPVELVVNTLDDQNNMDPAKLVARRQYMITPCRHVFHTDCMSNWMIRKLQCPVCRNPLPPM